MNVLFSCMSTIDTILVEQAITQARNAFAQYDLEILGGAVLSVRQVYLAYGQPLPEFCAEFAQRARSCSPSFPPVLYHIDGSRVGVGLAFTGAFDERKLEPFATVHEGYIAPIPSNETTKFTHGLFVPLPESDPRRLMGVEPNTVLFIYPPLRDTPA